jgi:hypothetical protein
MKIMKKNKTTEKTMKEFAKWVELNLIYKSWPHEDCENVTVYENLDGDIICIFKDKTGKILEAWIE